MGGKNLFNEPFDEGTLDKLSIYREYLKEWFPVFVSKPNPIWKTVQVFDFFAGEGRDLNGVAGSPVIAIEVLNLYKDLAQKNGVQIILHLNEKNRKSFEILKKNVEALQTGFQIHLYNEKFDVLFDRVCSSMKHSANFLFLDQNGIKEITPAYFEKITSLSQTDFLFFISSSFFKRFAQTTEFRKYFPFGAEEVEETDHYHMHRKVVDYYRSLIDRNKEYFLAPFSIKKVSNVYGLVFGTGHTFGIEKFLKVAWKKDTLRGEANFNIDSEKIDTGSPFLFEELNKPTKRQLFEQKLSERILSGTLTDRYDIYLYGLTEGFQMKDVNHVLKLLQQEGKIEFAFELLTSKLHKHKDQISLKVL